MNIKKITTFTLAGIMALSLCACGEKEESSSTASKAKATTAATEAPAVAENPTEAETEAPTEPEAAVVPYEYSIFDGKIKIDGGMPEGFKVLKRSDIEEASAAAAEAGEEFTPEYNFIEYSYALRGPEFTVEMGPHRYVFHTGVDYQEAHGEVEPNFQLYKENMNTDSFIKNNYPMIKDNFQIDGRDAVIQSIHYNEANNFAVNFEMDDYGGSSFELRFYKNDGSGFGTSDEINAFIESSEEVKLIFDNIKMTVTK